MARAEMAATAMTFSIGPASPVTRQEGYISDHIKGGRAIATWVECKLTEISCGRRPGCLRKTQSQRSRSSARPAHGTGANRSKGASLVRGGKENGTERYQS